MNVPGVKIVVPASPADAKGLLRTAMRGQDPVLFMEHKMLYADLGPVPEGDDFTVPFGQASVLREGSDVSLIAVGGMVPKTQESADRLAEKGIQAEVIDPRTLVPLDKATIIQSVAKTGRVVIVHEAHKRSGPGAEIAAMLAEEAIEYLDGPVVRVASKNVPIPYSPELETYVLPGVQEIVAAAMRLTGR